eukprot:SAG22_NODE_5665_length_975_cov_1.098174_1_plen_21_part_10
MLLSVCLPAGVNQGMVYRLNT